LTLNGGATYGPGQFGQALSLNGVEGTSASEATNNTAFDFASGLFTIQVWANFAAVNGEQTLIEKWTGESGPGWTLTTPGHIQFYDGYPLNSNPITFPTNVWQQFVVVGNGSTVSIFYDDSLVASGPEGPITTSPNPLLIGARDAEDGRNFTVDGLIDQTAIWGRALTTTEISYLYNDGAGREISNSVPEPSTWAMMLLGFAGLGFAGYWRSRNSSAPVLST
jgi:hypothetical protein